MANDVLVRVKVDADGRPIGVLGGQIDNLTRSAKNAGSASRGFIAQLTSTGAGLRGSALDAKFFAERLGSVGVQTLKTQGAISGLEVVASRSAAGITRGFVAAGAAITGALSVVALTRFLRSGIDLADQLNVISLRVGLSVESLSRLRFAANQSETDFETLAAGLQRLNINIGKSGVAGAQLGPVLIGIAEKIKNTSSAADQAAIANEALGRGIGAQLLPFLKLGADGIEMLTGKAADFAEISSETAREADEFNDSLSRLGAQALSLGIKIGGPLVNAVNSLFDAFENRKQTFRVQELNDGIDKTKESIDNLKGRISSGLLNDAQLKGEIDLAGQLTQQLKEQVKVRNDLTRPGRASVLGGKDASAVAIKEETQAAVDQITKISAAKNEADKEASRAAKAAASEARKAGREAASEAKTMASEAQAFLKKAQEQEKERIDSLREALDEEQAARDSVRNSIKEQITELGIEAEALRLGGAAGIRYATVQRETAKAIADDVDVTQELTAQINSLADAQAAAFESREFIQAQKDAQQELQRQYQESARVIEQSLTDAILRGFESGKGIAENFKDTLINLFKTLVLRPVIEAIVKPVAQIAQQVVGGLVNSVLGGGAGGGSSLLNFGSQALGLLGGAGASTAAGQVVPSLAGSSSSLGNIASSLSSASSTLTSIPGLLNSVITGFQSPALAKFATLAAQELGTAVGGQAFGGSAAGFVGSLGPGLTNIGFGAIGTIIGKQLGLGGGTIADEILSTVGGIAGGAIGGAIAAGTGAAAAAGAATATGIAAAGGSAAAAAAGGSAAAAGAAAGSVVPVIGTIIGAILGVALGSTIQATPPRGFQSADFSSGTLRIRKGGKKGFDASELDAPINQLTGSLQEIDKVLDLDLIKKKIKFFIGFKAGKGFQANIGGEDVNFEGKDALGRTQGAIFKEELLGALPNKERSKFQKTVLARAFDPKNDLFVEQLQSIQKDLGVQQRLKDFVKLVQFDPRTEKLKELRSELKDLARDFSKLRGEARELGLDTQKAEKAFKKTVRRKKDEILGVQIEGEAQKIGAQQQAYQLAGKAVPIELQQQGLISQFKVLGISFRELGLDTQILDELLSDALANLEANIALAKEQATLSAQTQAYQLAGRQAPIHLQEAGIRLQFTQLGKAFEELGLDSSILTELLADAIANLQQAQQQARLSLQARAFQLAGQEVPLDLQRAGITLEFAQLGEQFRELGLDASALTELLARALRNLDEAQRMAQLAGQERAYQLAGRQIPIELQRQRVIAEFAAIGNPFSANAASTGAASSAATSEASRTRALATQAQQTTSHLAGLVNRWFQKPAQTDTEVQIYLSQLAAYNDSVVQLIAANEAATAAASIAGPAEAAAAAAAAAAANFTRTLADLQAEALRNLETASTVSQEERELRLARQNTQEQAYQLAGRQVPQELQIAGIILQFSSLGDSFRELGLDTGILSGLLTEALANLVLVREQARQSAQERAYQLAGVEIPKALQIAGIRAEFAELRGLFTDLGLDTGILGGLLQEGIDRINRATEDLKSGGFIGFLDEFGRVSESQTFRSDISSLPVPPIHGFATGTSNRIVTRPELFLAGERGPESVNVVPISNAGGRAAGGDVNIYLDGPAIFDDITQAKFTRTVARQIQARQTRFG